MRELAALVDTGDVAALLRAVDGMVSTRDWDELADLAERCQAAAELTGRQLWGVAMHIEYRLAWEAPPRWAAAVLRPGAARFALGPLTEVAASSHTWAELAPYLDDPVTAATVAQERVVRGEDVAAGPLPACGAIEHEPPLTPQAWEPTWALPRYRDRSAEFPGPAVDAVPLGAPRALAGGAPGAPDLAVRALEDLVEPWVALSEGVTQAVVVEGDAEAAVGALASRAALAPVDMRTALALLHHAAASGGTRGRRPGGARGRFAVWWAATALAGLDWPPHPDELGAAATELRWYRWAPPAPAGGWTCRIAVADPVDGLAWALDAVDRAPLD